ncbi:exopolysaccharide transport family protein [Viscerimonas tarda]
MEQNTRTNELNDPYLEEVQANTRFSFDFILWFYRILKYWYLFVISLIVFLGYAYIKNKSWKPSYITSAVLMIESRGSNIGLNNNAVNFGSIVRNSVNQKMMLTSHDMIARTVAKLPQLRINYFTKTKFRTENLYGYTPVEIEYNFVAPSAYDISDYKIEPIDSEKCRISYEATETVPPFSMDIPYGQFVQESRFFIKIKKTNRFTSNFQPFYFRFVPEGELMNRYQGRVYTYEMAEGSSALSVKVVGDNSNQDAEFLSTLFKEFQEYNLSLKNEAADNTIRFIDRQLKIINDSLQVAETTLHDFQERTGIYKVESGEDRQKMNETLTRLGEMKARENSILLLTEIINNTIRKDEELVDPASLGLDQEVGKTNLSTLVTEYNIQLAKMRGMPEVHPSYYSYADKLNGMRIKILEGLKTLQGKMQAEKETLRADSAQLGTYLAVLPAQEREFLQYQRDYTVNDAYSTYLINKKYEASLQKASNVPDNYVLEAPRPNNAPTNEKEKENTFLLYFLVGLALPLGFIICKEELFNFSISTKEECEKISGLPVIGTIENISKKMSNTAVLVKNFPKSSFAESFRNMRIRIEYLAQKEQSISLLVTSAEPADGKTFVAANMASVYQLTGKKVILIDFDLRRPSVAKNLGVHSKKGVSNYLIGQVSLDDIVITHPEFGFDIIAAGTLPPNPSELIKTKRTKELITYLKSNYDFVIIDCSPIGLVSDAYILSRFVDTVLFVVRRGKTNKSFLKSVVSQVKDDGLDRFALVFNDVKGREGYYGTSRYYGDKSYYLKRNSYYHDDYFEK